jgi:hypothetical protein
MVLRLRISLRQMTPKYVVHIMYYCYTADKQLRRSPVSAMPAVEGLVTGY